jgi:phosphoenolpyruvate carboxylase
MLPALIDLYESWSETLGEGGDVPAMLKLGSWLGGDRDGHPGVTGETLKLALGSQARVILDVYAAEVRRLWSDLAISDVYEGASEALLTLARASTGSARRRSC